MTTFPRVAYEAFKLYYFKGLVVYSRPEPLAGSAHVDRELGTSLDGWNEAERDGGVGARVRTTGPQPPKVLEVRGHELARPQKSTAVNRGSDDEKPAGAPIGSIFVELVSTPMDQAAETFTIPIRWQLPDPSTSSSPASPPPKMDHYQRPPPRRSYQHSYGSCTTQRESLHSFYSPPLLNVSYS
ncbi:hypothetical protein DL93DRAFT_2188838 [Clavulina sp. PMI_390]|nr:hypothetical protein DL93DRAFT_2188838 [Clavulina sp. PMI_390]